MGRVTRKPSTRKPTTRPKRVTGTGKQIEWLLAGDLRVDGRYERDLSPTRVEQIANNFDPDAFGTIEVAERNGRYYVLDGQHRIAALRSLGWLDQKVPCLIYSGLDLKGEARTFRKLNEKRKSLTQADILRAKVTEGDAQALSIMEVLDVRGLKVRSGGREPGMIHAASALVRIHDEIGPNGLGSVLDLCTVWPDDGDRYSGQVMLGLALFLSRYPDAEKSRLEKVLSRVSPSQLTQAGRNYKQGLDSRIHAGIGRVLWEQYHKGLRGASKHLPPWPLRAGRDFWAPVPKEGGEDNPEGP